MQANTLYIFPTVRLVVLFLKLSCFRQSHVAQADLELGCVIRMILNSLFSCPYLLSAGVIGTPDLASLVYFVVLSASVETWICLEMSVAVVLLGVFLHFRSS